MRRMSKNSGSFNQDRNRSRDRHPEGATIAKGAHLKLSFVSGKACPGFTDFTTGPWTRVP